MTIDIPEVWVIGFPKCASTSFHFWLTGSPTLRQLGPVKESKAVYPYLQGSPLNRDRLKYQSGCLDSSPDTIYAPENVVAAITSVSPKQRFIVLLRDPVARTTSAYNFKLARGLIPNGMPFPHFVQEGVDALQKRGFGYHNDALFPIAGSSYGRFLGNWDCVDRSRIRCIDVDALANEPMSLVNATLTWLGRPQMAEETDLAPNRNETFGARSQRINTMAWRVNAVLDPLLSRTPQAKAAIKRLYLMANGRKPSIPADDLRGGRAMLRQFYASEPSFDSSHLQFLGPRPEWLGEEALLRSG